MKRIDVVKKRDGWAGQSGGRTVPNTKAPTKAEAVKKAQRPRRRILSQVASAVGVALPAA